MQIDEQKLKLALAKELPELITIRTGKLRFCVNGTPHTFSWKGSKDSVTPREWDWVVQECESKLDNETVDKRSLFIDYLAIATDWPNNVKNAADLRFEVHYNTIRATWQQRAIAYFKTIGKEVV